MDQIKSEIDIEYHIGGQQECEDNGFLNYFECKFSISLSTFYSKNRIIPFSIPTYSNRN